MSRFARWLIGNADGSLALAIAVVAGLLGVLDVLGTDEIDAAILLTLALLAATLLRDRKLAARAFADNTAVRTVSGPEVGQVAKEAHRDTELWMFKGRHRHLPARGHAERVCGKRQVRPAPAPHAGWRSSIRRTRRCAISTLGTARR